VDILLKSILIRIMHLVVGGTITGIILIYFFGFLVSILVNNIIWLFISSFLYRYYWKLNGLEDVLILGSFIFYKLMKKIKK
jgi:hypothetical protein